MWIIAAPTPTNLANVHGVSKVGVTSPSCVRTTFVGICMEVEPFWAALGSVCRWRRLLAGGVALAVDILMVTALLDYGISKRMLVSPSIGVPTRLTASDG